MRVFLKKKFFIEKRYSEGSKNAVLGEIHELKYMKF